VVGRADSAGAVALGVLVAVGIAVRLLALRWSASLNADEAVEGLMGLHIAAGRAAPVFYYGQHYFGALEAYLLAGLFKVVGFHPWLLFAPPLAASVALIPLTAALGRCLLTPPSGARAALAGSLAALPVAAATPVLARTLLNAGGGFALAYALQAAALLCFLRAFSGGPSPRHTVRWAAAFSLVAGFLCWVWQPAILVVAVLLVALSVWHWRMVRALRLLPALALLPLLVGTALPLVYNAKNGFPTVAALAQKVALPPLEAPPEIAQSPFAVPILLGMAAGGGEANYGGTNWLQTGAVATAVLGVLGLALRRDAPGAGRTLVNRPVAAVLALASITNVVAAHGAVRHLLPAALIAFAFFGAAPALCFTLSTRQRVTLAGGLAVLVLVPNLWFLPRSAGAFGDRPPFGSDVQTVVNRLNDRGLTHGYSDYWTAYPVTYVSGERIVLAPLAATIWGGRFDRFPDYTREVDTALPAGTPFLLLDFECSPTPYLQPLADGGATYRLDGLPGYFLLWKVQVPPPSQAEALAGWRNVIASRHVC
jgi:hypothetical protein